MTEFTRRRFFQALAASALAAGVALPVGLTADGVAAAEKAVQIEAWTLYFWKDEQTGVWLHERRRTA